jgi:tetratricopeptide (TPR) repeat protein
MSAASDPGYARYIESLVLQRTVAEIRGSVANSDIDLRGLDRSFDAVREEWQGAGREAGCALLDFVKLQLSDLLTGPGAPPTEINDAAVLLEATMSAPTILRARTLLNLHRKLVTPELLDMVQSKIIPARGQAPMAEIGLLTCLIARLLGDLKAQVKGLLIWSSLCQKNHRFNSAERRLKRAAQLAAEVGDPETQLLVMSTQAGLYRHLGRIPEAIEIFEASIKLPGVDRIVLISVLHGLSSCYRQNGQNSKALDTLTQLVSLLADDLPDKKFEALNLRGLIFEELGQYDKGAVSYEAAIAVAAQMGDRGRQFTAMNNHAASLLKRGLTKDGINAFQDVLCTVEKWGHPPMIASTHNNLGTALSQMERYAEARSEYRKALRSKMDTGDLNGQFICFQGMGDAARDMGDTDGAKQDYAMALLPALETMDASLVASITMRTSEREFRQSGSIDESIKSLEWARELCRQQACNHEGFLLTRQLIDCYVEAGSTSEALSECRQALASDSFDPEMVGLLSIVVNYARLTAAEPGGWKTAFDLLSERSRRIDLALEEAVIDARRAEIISSAFEAYAGLIDLLAAPEASQILSSPSPQELAFDLHESAKCRSFLSSVAEAPVNPPGSIPEALRTAEAEFLRLVRALQEEGATKSEAYRDEKLRETRSTLGKLWEEMKPFAPGYVRFRSGAPYKFREMAALLPTTDGETTFVSFFVDKRLTRCFLFHRGALAPKIVTVELGREELTRIAKQLRRTFNGAPEEFPPYPSIRGDMPFRRKLDFLDPLCTAMSGFFQAVEGADLIVVAPHGPLHLIPLQILRCADGKFLAEKSAVVYTPSLSTSLQALQRSHKPAKTGTKIPVFAAGVSSADDSQPQYFESDAELFDTERWDLTAAFGVKQAARKSVLSSLARQAVVHLSSHGFFDSRDPLNSGLVFSDGTAKAPRNLNDVPLLDRQNFLVTARDLMRASLSADLVTVSACSSGLQTARNAGDEMEGFTRALLAAGAATSLVAMWNVDQASSHGLLANFYAQLASAGDVSAKWRALRAAQLAYIKSDDENLRHPYHWAPFVLIGDWR